MLKKLLFLSCVTGLCYLSGLSVPSAIAQQTATLTGTITDAKTGETISSANVYLKEIQRGAASDAHGHYSISDLPTGQYTLRVTFVGYQTYSKKVTLHAGRNTVNVELKQGAIGLGQLVVTGYGQKTSEKGITTSISSISDSSFSNIAVQNSAQVMQGRIPGVQVTENAGTAGSGFRVRVRGTGSINAGGRPLYIVDGVEISYSNQVGEANVSPLNGIPPDDIESISVLKSASATAIYGAQGANGVVIITTKSGQQGKAQVTASYERGVRTSINNVDYGNRNQWLEYYRRAAQKTYGDILGKNAGDTYLRAVMIPRYGLGTTIKANPFDPNPGSSTNNYYDGKFSDLPNTNWVDFVNHVGIHNEYNMSVSGGGKQTTYYVTGGYNNTGNSIKSNSYQNYHISTKFNYKVSSRFNLKLDLNLSNQKKYGSCQGGYYINCPGAAPAFLAPVAHPYNKDGSYSKNFPLAGATANPALIIDQLTRKVDIVHILGNISGTYDFAPWISLKTEFGEDWREGHDIYYTNLNLNPTTNGERQDIIRTTPNFNTTTTLHINKSFSEVHNFSALLGFSYRRDFTYSVGGDGIQFPGNFVSVLQGAAKPNAVYGYTDEYRKAGYFANVKYNYHNRYYLNLTGRYEGSSRFGRNDQWGFFPAISGAWDISSEKWFNVGWVNTLKLRAGYGETGNSLIGRYPALSLYNVTGKYGGSSGLQPSQLANADLTWEDAREIDAGIDYSLFRGRVDGSLDFYTTNHTGLLLNRPLPHSSGFTSITQNIGKTNNKGVEFSIHTINIRRAGFQWSTNFNVSIQKNTIKSLVGDNHAVDAASIRPRAIGHSIYALKLYQWAGVNPADGRPMWYNKDGNLTYHPTDSDRNWFDGGEQDAYGGFGTTLQYKGLSLRAFFQYSYGQTASPSNVYAFDVVQPGATQAQIAVDRLKHSWTHPGQYAEYPYLQISNSLEYPGTVGYDYAESSNSFYYSTTYLRLKDITLRYNLPKTWTNQLHLDNIQLYITAYNLVTWTAWPGNDPEVGDTNGPIDQEGQLPAERQINGGIRIKF
jgi:TonB-linked SusC/RagA family outer membrane protein